MAGRQTTLRGHTHVCGVGVHSGLPINLTLAPAEANSGIVFIVESAGQPQRRVRVAPGAVAASNLATVLGDEKGAAVSTVEHVLAALYGLGVDNAVVEVDGPEIPIMDGSAAPFVAAIDGVGIVELDAPRRYLRIRKPVGVVAGESYVELRPHDGFRLEVEIDFAHTLVGRQKIELDLDPVCFRRRLARARTFGFMRDVEHLWRSGYALGASLENTLVVGEDRIVNPEGLRFSDEFVRHKALDAVGDLAIAGAPILGAYRSVRGGHRLNHAVLLALMAERGAWEVVEAAVPAPAQHVGARVYFPGHAELRGAALASDRA